MGFITKPDEFFSGRVVEPGGDGEAVVVSRGTRAAAISLTVAEAERRNWDWIIDLNRNQDDEDLPVVTLATWSSMSGELPPASRKDVPGL
jgi:hypothetical protein